MLVAIEYFLVPSYISDCCFNVELPSYTSFPFVLWNGDRPWKVLNGAFLWLLVFDDVETVEYLFLPVGTCNRSSLGRGKPDYTVGSGEVPLGFSFFLSFFVLLVLFSRSGICKR